MSSTGGGLQAQPLSTQSSFNWVFLVELLTVGILSVFFLFYFNRLFSTLVSYAIRAYTWRAYRAYVDIQALQISFLGGRLFFKHIRYHAHNETIVVHGGFITWRYWLRKVREAEVYTKSGTESRSASQSSANTSQHGNADSEEKGGRQPEKTLPCRIEIKVSGVEAFIYNRSPVYDAIIENVARKATAEKSTFSASENGGRHSRPTSSPSSAKERDGINDISPEQSSQQQGTSAVYRKPTLPSFLRIFPIHVECNKAAAVLGNENTRCILTAKIDSASGVFEAGPAGPLDIYKQIFAFEVVHPVITLKPNVDFREPQLATAVRLKDESSNGPFEPAKSSKNSHPSRKARHFLEKLSPSFRKSFDSIATAAGEKPKQRATSGAPVPGQERWLGLTRYLDEEQNNEHDEWEPIEYAKSSTIADIPKIGFSFYWDVPGEVGGFDDDLGASAKLDSEDANGTIPPAYGMDLHVHGGTVSYGPWADRMRIDFQNIFFPPTYVDAVPTKRLSPGQYRLNTVFKLFLCVEEDITLRLPFRENSKDWKWKGQAESIATSQKSKKDKDGKTKGRMRLFHRDKASTAPTVRPFAWIDVKIRKDTTINYTGDMYARKIGYTNTLIGDIRGTEVLSSVNHGLLWRSGSFGLDLDISYPLGWSTVRDWRFNITSNDLHMFILRDHLFLLTDLIVDWTTGPPPDYYTFVPYVYRLNLDFHNFKLYLNTNDANIINDPSSMDDNHYIILYGGRLFGDVRIPLDQFRPKKNEIPFSVKGLDFGLDMCMPPRSTLSCFAQHPKVATLEEVTLSGSHTAWTETSTALTDTLTFDIHGTKFLLLFYGFLAHHLVRVKENYFGDDLHFRTLEEYQQLLAREGVNPDADAEKNSNRGNDLDVILCIAVDDASAVIPANIYHASDNLTVEVPFSTVDLRIGNYYMDLMLNLSPISISLGNTVFEEEVPLNSTGRTQIFIDSVEFMGNRLFGLPPVEPPYCCNWDVSVGDISGECSDEFLSVVARTAQAAMVGFPDAENTLPIAYPIIIRDVQFLQLRTRSIRLWFHVQQDALLVDLQNTSVEFNDWAGELFSGRVNIGVPQLTMACVDCSTIQRHSIPTARRRLIKTHAYLQTSVSLKVLMRKADFEKERELQQAHVRLHDRRTNRAQFLLLPEDTVKINSGTSTDVKVEPPTLVLPSLPAPLQTRQWTSTTSSNDSLSDSSYSRGRSAPSTVGSSYFARQKNPHRKASRASLSNSVSNSLGKHEHRRPRRLSARSIGSQVPSTPTVASDVWAEGRSGPNQSTAEHFSVAFSSPLSAPVLALDSFDLDLTEVPRMTDQHNSSDAKYGEKELTRGDSAYGTFDESIGHNSLVISVDSGVRGFVSPGAVSCALNALNEVQPRGPEDVLDSFYGTVLGRLASQTGPGNDGGNSLDVALEIPAVALRFINAFDIGKDQFDLNLSPVAVSVRTINYPSDRCDQNTLSLHVSLQHLELSLREISMDGSNDVAIQMHLDDVLVWLVQKDSLSVNVSYKALQVGSSSRKVDYLSGLVDRYLVLIERILAEVQHQQEEQSDRLRYLAQSLTTAGDNITDPTFLTRPSYVMRSARGHVRQHDSWKIMSRFRYIYLSLSRESRRALSDKLMQSSFEVPQDAQQRVLDTWDRWRAWDLSHVKKSIAMLAIYGEESSSNERSSDMHLPLDLSIRSGKTGFIVDPGPKQSKFSIHGLHLALCIVPPSSPSGLKLATEESRESVRVQLDSKVAKLHVNWQICELVESITEVILHNQTYREKLFSPDPKTSHEAAAPALAQDFQVVAAIDAAVLSVDSNNLQNTNAATDLKLSLVGSKEAHAKPDRSISALLHCKMATADVHAGSRHLVRLQSQSPSLLFSDEVNAAHGNDLEVVKVLGSTSSVLIQTREEILGLIEVVDAVIQDEAAYVKQQIDFFTTLQREYSNQSTAGKSPDLPELTIALAMDSYEIDLALLQSLTYSFAGTVGRVSIQPDLQQKFALKVDIDLSPHQHFLRSNDHIKHDIAALRLPHINGQLYVIARDSVPNITASFIVETIELDASALHGLFDTFRRPELSKTVNAIKADVATVQRNVEQIFLSANKTQDTDTKSSPGAEYNIHFVLDGIQIIAATQSSAASRSAAKLTVGLSTTRVTASNKPKKGAVLYPIPEIHAQVGKIFADLTVADAKGQRQCGDVSVSVSIDCIVRIDKNGFARHDFNIYSDRLSVNLFADTASAVVDVVNHLQDRIRELDLSRERRYLQRLQRSRRQTAMSLQAASSPPGDSGETSSTSSALFESSLSLQLLNIKVRWVVGKSVEELKGYRGEDLVFSIKTIDLATKSEDTARLAILGMQLALMTASEQATDGRGWNSALLPELVFTVAHRSGQKERNLWFHAAGKLLDVQLEPKFMLPVSMVQRSIELAVKKFQDASSTWQQTPTSSGTPRQNPFGNKRLGSLVVDADFAGAQLQLQDRKALEPEHGSILLPNSQPQTLGRYGQFVAGGGNSTSASIRSPGLALKVQYTDPPDVAPSLNLEVRLDASSNTLYPTIVPLIIEMSDTVKEVVQQRDTATAKGKEAPKAAPQKFLEDSDIFTTDPAAVLGKIQLNLGFRICKQEFSLSCQPVARVAATAQFENIYMTVSSVRSEGEQHNFFALSSAIEGLQASVQHVYSRESTFSFDADSITLSLINSKHLSGTAGISAILKISPMRTQMNVRQLQDFLLFREIWFPQEIRSNVADVAPTPDPTTTAAPEEYLIQRYQQVAATAAFPWTATVSIEELGVELDLGQAIGKSSLKINDLWASSKKNSDWEQNLCFGIGSVGIESSGRMSGIVELEQFSVRTTITWPQHQEEFKQTPRIQASAGFDRLRLKSAFDYQAFAISDITEFNFMMYNVKVDEGLGSDRLVAILNGGNIRAYVTATTASQVVALAQAFERLIQDNQTAYAQSLRDVEKFLRRKSAVTPPIAAIEKELSKNKKDADKLPISLHTDVVVTLKSFSAGCFPSSFTDSQVLLIEALDVQARFAVALLESRQIHSALGMTLGQLRVALAPIPHSSTTGPPKPVGELSIDEVVSTVVTTARGGVILRVPKVIAAMQTWQETEGNHIDYIFKSSFEGKVDVGWNLSRISFIRNMWTNHSRTLAARLGKPLPESAVKITTAAEPVPPPSKPGREEAMPALDEREEDEEGSPQRQEKITAVVNVPQSGYEYTALEPPIIETPQLRDMGEATPPLEWIGLHRDRLPNVTHQILIVTLLEVAKEVEDAYGRILGRS